MSGPRLGFAALAGGGSPAGLAIQRRLLWAGLALLAVGFVVAAASRRLNFDEALALRAGWLAVQELSASPPFFMPLTWLLGLLGSAVSDPGTVLLVARLAVVATVVPALAWSLAAGRRAVTTTALAVALTLSQATFVVHGLEFRYDWALLLGWLFGYRLVTRRGPRDFLYLGLVAAWLATHHLKGLYFAICLLLLASVAAAFAEERRRRWWQLAAGFAGGIVGWLALAAACGFADESTRVYTTFFSLAAGSETRQLPWQTLGGTFRRDTVWWLGALLAVIATVWRLPRSWRSLVASRDLWSLVFALAPLGFLFLHPHPWAYMLVLPAPFLALLMAERLAETAPRPAPVATAGALALVLALQWAATRTTPWQSYFDALAAPRDRQVATLRLLHRNHRPGDRIFDPSGLAYFVEPCTGEWYLDTLFEESAERGEWMAELRQVDLQGCSWMLNTYRLRMLPTDLKDRFTGGYALIPGGGGLALQVEDSRLAGSLRGDLAYRELFSFW